LKDLKLAEFYFFGKFVKLRQGNSTFLKFIPRNVKISFIEIKPNTGAKLVRAPGSWGVIKKKIRFFSYVRLRSGVIKKLYNSNFCTIGRVLKVKYKRKSAGFARISGFRPTVRGLAMNPVDHPHGGGEGKKI